MELVNSCQNRDNCDHNKEFDESEACFAVARVSSIRVHCKLLSRKGPEPFTCDDFGGRTPLARAPYRTGGSIGI